jgi:hypothetical protein
MVINAWGVSLLLLQERPPYLQVFYAQKPFPTLVNIATKYSVVYDLIWPKFAQLQMLHFVHMTAKFVQDPSKCQKMRKPPKSWLKLYILFQKVICECYEHRNEKMVISVF